MRAPSAFRQTDVTRAIRAAKAARMRPHVWIGRDGSIHITEAAEAAEADLRWADLR
ncbi:MAG: hypothetical protein LCH78_10815 [Proteobacteria bacterium]|nr:hypothetical protein [Pseudomonadota bacterium]